MRLARLLICTCGILLAVLAGDLPGTALADGGAPNLAYVAGAGSGAGDVAVIDIAKRQVTGQVTIGHAPGSVALSSDARTLYVAETAGSGVAIVDARNLQVTGTIATPAPPLGLTINYTNAPLLYIALANGAVAFADPDTNKLLATVPVGKRLTAIGVAGPGNGTVSGQDLEVYVADPDGNQVVILNARTHQVLATIPIPGGPEGIVIPSASGIAYVLTQSGQIDVIGLASHRVQGHPLLIVPGAQFGAADYDAITNQVYVPDGAHNTVLVLAPVTSAYGSDQRVLTEPRATLNVSNKPAAAAITFDGSYGFIAAQGNGQVTMLDAATRATLTTITVGGAPTAIITGAYAPLLDRQTSSIVGIGLSLVALLVIIGVATFIYLRGRRAESNHAA